MLSSNSVICSSKKLTFTKEQLATGILSSLGIKTTLQKQEWTKIYRNVFNIQYNEEKSVVAERFIRTLKYKTYKYMTSVSKMCILIS